MLPLPAACLRIKVERVFEERETRVSYEFLDRHSTEPRRSLRGPADGSQRPWSARITPQRLLVIVGRQGQPHHFDVVPRNDVPVRERRMRPEDRAVVPAA